ncbi:MAG TPA: FAD-binding protein [Nitrospirae bacterium]|nr:putative FAD-linked oxidoreductase [bacterium BMS3Abin10]HDK41363.1 FAD-binding protein [Nitrospirota bacterium]HDK82234.1 FAD-binding protein [Nitrospirota bacterium]
MKNIKDILPHRVLTEPEDLFCYGFDASSKMGRPLAVVRPVSTDEVSRAAAFAFKHGIPLVPRGAGSGMTAGAVPLKDSVIVSLEAMNRVLEIDDKNLVAVVEPGVINARLQHMLESKGLFYPPDPSSMDFCTLGGNVAENAGGPRALKYGVTKDYVLGLEIVLPDGSVLTTGVKTYKGVVGYDLTRLVVGSEGTLAFITKIFLKVLPLPEETVTLLCAFTQMDKAATAVSRIISAKIIPGALEFMDRETVRAVEDYKPFGLPGDAEALLLIEVDGPGISVPEAAEEIASICGSLGAEVKVADDVFSKQRLWEARRAISPALYRISPSKINEDVVVPRGKIPDMLRSLRDISDRYRVKIVNFGHAGDGNIHVNIMTDRNDKEEYQRAEKAVREVFEAALALGGTISGEHGIGLTKAGYLGMELSPENIMLMKGIKKVFDPKGIMNPGKIFSAGR